MSFVGSNILAGASGQGGGGYAIERSLRFNSGDSAYLSRNFAASNRKTWTWSGWFKLSKLGQRNYIFTNWNSSGMSSLYLEWTNLDTIRVGEYSGSAWEWRLDSISQFRDPSAWYHLVVAIDTTQSTASDRVKVYINGEQLTSFSPSDYPNQNKDTYVNQAVEHNIGRLQTTEADFYLADVHFIDGQALAPTDFGETDEFGVWQPKAYDGTYGTSVDQSQTWSNNITGGSGAYGAAANAFNGSLSDFASPEYSSPMTYTNPSASDTVISTFEIYGRQYSTSITLELNDTDIKSQLSTTEQWHTITGFTGQNFSKLYWRPTSGNSEVRIYAIRINGKLLVDSGISLSNNGFHLDFADNSSNAALGTDTSGNNNTWTVNNLTANVPPPSSSFTWSGSLLSGTGGSGNAGGYTGSYFQIPAGTSSWDLHNETDGNTGFWFSDSSSQVAGHPPDQNGNFVALRNNGSGTASTGGSGFSSTGFPTDSMDGDPRWYFTVNRTTGAGTVKVGPSGTVYYFTVPTTGNVYFHVNAYGAYNYNLGYGSPADIDSLVDSPNNGTQTDSGAGGEVVGNYAVLNPLDITTTTTTFSNGNLDITSTGESKALASFTPSSGKWYLEVTLGSIVVNSWIGLYGTASSSSAACVYGINGYGFYSTGFGSITNTVSGSGSTGDVIGVALDIDAKTLEYYKNGVSLGTVSNIVFPSSWAIGMNCNATLTSAWSFNFGQRAFAHTAPSGYKALNTANLPEPTIADGSKYFDVIAASGTGASKTFTMPGGWGPDFVWAKSRSNTSNNALFDVIRGATKRLVSNSTNAEDTQSNQLTAFTSDGFTYGSDIPNQSGDSGVYWAWDAGSSNTTIAAGGLNSSVYSFGYWESMVTGTYDNNHGWGTDYQTSNAFDANLTTYTIGAANATGWTFTPSTAITGSVIEVYGINDACPNDYMKVNGNNFGNSLQAGFAAKWHNLGVTTLSSIYLRDNSSGNAHFRLSAIRVDGKILAQTGSVPNVPSIASTVRANPTAGFSITKYNIASSSSTIDTFATGLNAAPAVVILKPIDDAQGWTVYHKDIPDPTESYLFLESNSDYTDSNVATFTSSSLTFGCRGGRLIPGGASGDILALCFTPVEGYSAFGSYTGRGSTNVFVYTGMAAKFIMIKCINAVKDWLIFDTGRYPNNQQTNTLAANGSGGEGSGYNIDILSNGFILRNDNSHINASGNTYLYLAFAEHPFKNARAR